MDPRPRRGVVVPVASVLSGSVAGIGSLVLAAQFAVAYPTGRGVALAAISGAGLSVVAANAVVHLVAVSPTAEPVWAATHLVPDSGLDAYASHEADGAADRLDPLLPVRVTERWGDWARIECSNGWTAWTDGRLLQEVSW